MKKRKRKQQFMNELNLFEYLCIHINELSIISRDLIMNKLKRMKTKT